ncbi:tRNA 2-selenouridine(34) synthase MnmH [Paenibacillus lignilyticus]|uniref:tRNA 2-selenouridine(34) synthase MnmH n=1 Tax=Paenibacillus lignilyticus TaxID=1172615 RepID=A0ABS5CDK1_9BACL|nr:tRNA 2-selenouridine(34) synthase MnmH [Paenibacillus lignilyticus]MBP3964060.1 tRNA 2-selenouridine(34) synthase MnmH [Paenibacillus lignilyticus]
MFQDLKLHELLDLRQQKKVVTIDVRSPSEFEDATIPGSLNIPFFDDNERAEIGTIYKQVSIQAAKERGLEIFSAKLPSFIKEFSQIPGKKAVFCWRGGMRSKTTATVLSLMDIHVSRLEGGYRAFRQGVVQALDELAVLPTAYVLHGNTGSGKTAILRRLQQSGYPVLNFEELAGHRGSVFGNIGVKAHNQKKFDASLVDELLSIRQAPYLLFEAESKRIGKVVIPEQLLQLKEVGHQIWLEVPLETRVQHILEEYRPWEHQEACLKSFLQIKSRIHTPVAAEIDQCLKEEKYDRAVELLLVYYYDQRYAHTASGYNSENKTIIAAPSTEEAVEAIKQLLPT